MRYKNISVLYSTTIKQPCIVDRISVVNMTTSSSVNESNDNNDDRRPNQSPIVTVFSDQSSSVPQDHGRMPQATFNTRGVTSLPTTLEAHNTSTFAYHEISSEMPCSAIPTSAEGETNRGSWKREHNELQIRQTSNASTHDVENTLPAPTYPLDQAAEATVVGIRDGSTDVSRCPPSDRPCMNERETAVNANNLTIVPRVMKAVPEPVDGGVRPGAYHVQARAHGPLPAWRRRIAQSLRRSHERTSRVRFSLFTNHNSQQRLPPELRTVNTDIPPELRVYNGNESQLQPTVTQQPHWSNIPPEVRPVSGVTCSILDASVNLMASPGETTEQPQSSSHCLLSWVCLAESLFLIAITAGLGVGIGIAAGRAT